MISARTAAGLAMMVAAAAWSVAAGAETAAPAPAQPPAAEGAPTSVAITWDREANIKEAAERIGLIQRTRGAEAAIKHIDACYRTHGLASAYSAAFEACIAQDYMETKLLTRVYGRMPPERLRKMGAPTAAQLAQAMGRRVVAAFQQYKVSAADATAFQSEVDKVGMPVFLKTVFPNAAAEIDALGGKFDETNKDKEKN
ncbi:MAG: hypothetical protein K2Q28_02600 [Hyphomicrobium sp.]|nr:hypothetical protein [Hyphomicrobium sp.]